MQLMHLADAAEFRSAQQNAASKIIWGNDYVSIASFYRFLSLLIHSDHDSHGDHYSCHVASTGPKTTCTHDF